MTGSTGSKTGGDLRSELLAERGKSMIQKVGPSRAITRRSGFHAEPKRNEINMLFWKRSGKDHFWTTKYQNIFIDIWSTKVTVKCALSHTYCVCVWFSLLILCGSRVKGAMSGCCMWAQDQHHPCGTNETGTHLPKDPMFMNGRLDFIPLKIIQM